MQCMATAMTAGAAATGLRALIATHTPSWITPRRLKIATAAILTTAVLAAGSQVSSTPSSAEANAGEAPAETHQAH